MLLKFNTHNLAETAASLLIPKEPSLVTSLSGAGFRMTDWHVSRCGAFVVNSFAVVRPLVIFRLFLIQHKDRILTIFRACFVAFAFLLSLPLSGQRADHRPSKSFSLSNGLTVVVDEEPTVPNVAVELWVRSGTRYEESGHWGEAHFFEHMFGATRLPVSAGRVLAGNAQTRRDFCRYYLLVGSEALEYALAVQADRLDYPLDAMTESRLAANRDIVLNEYRGYESRPFGFGSATEVKQLLNGFGQGHPYGRPIQSNEDISKLTAPDMQRWIIEHHLPSDAILLIAGNVTVDRVRELVNRYFGSIPSVRSPQIQSHFRVTAQPLAPTPELHEQVKVSAPSAHLLAAWATPAYGTAEADYLTLFAEILADQDTSRLRERLVSDRRLATSVSASEQIEELAGMIRASVILRPGVDASKATGEFSRVLDDLSKKGPTLPELAIAKARLKLRFEQQWERFGFQNSRIDVLGEGALFRGNPEAYRDRLNRIETATPSDILRASQKWISGHGYFLTALPQSESLPTESVDRTKPVSLPPISTPTFPQVETRHVTGSLTLAALPRQSGLVDVTLVIPIHSEAETPDIRKVVADAMLDRDPSNTTMRARLWRRCVVEGATVDLAADPDATIVTIETLAANTQLAIQAMMSLFAKEALDRGAIKRALSENREMRSMEDTSSLVSRKLLGILREGGTAAPELEEPQINNVEGSRFFKTAGSTLIVAGGFQPSSLNILTDERPDKLEVWRPLNNQPLKPTTRPTVYIWDVPGRTQSLILSSQRLEPITVANLVENRLAIAIASSRVNTNLREHNHWSYGARAALAAASDGTPILTVSSEVQSDHVADSIIQISHELADRISSNDLSRLPFYRRDLKQEIVGRIDSVSGLADVLANLARLGLPLTICPDLLQQVDSIDQKTMEAALQHLGKSELVFVVAGDKAKLQQQLSAAGFELIALPSN